MSLALLGGAALALLVPARAADFGGSPADPADGWVLQIDDDTFVVQKDRDYTGGLSFRRTGPAAASHPLSLDRALGRTDRILGFARGDVGLEQSFEMGMVAFTPEQVHTEAPVYNDRPYASLVYLANARLQLRPNGRSALVSELTAGILGLDTPAHVQNALHRLVNADGVDGWGNQISDGGEPTLRYRLAWQRNRWFRRGADGPDYEVKTSLQGSAGFLTDVGWAVTGRWGRLSSPWWSINPQLDGYGAKTATLFPVRMADPEEFYLYSGLNLSLRLYNVFLQGQFRHSTVTYEAGDLQRLLLEGWIGVAKTTAGGTRFSYLVHGQTRELKRGAGTRHLLWAGVTVSRAY